MPPSLPTLGLSVLYLLEVEIVDDDGEGVGVGVCASRCESVDGTPVARNRARRL
jgi:hypothetical protein